jgi:hypothetical protein
VTRGTIQTEQQRPREGKIDLWEKIRGMKSIDKICLSESGDQSWQAPAGKETVKHGGRG